MKIKSLILSLVTAFGFAASAHASLLDGKIINYQYYFPEIGSPAADASNGNHLVGAGLEVSNIAESVGTIDISDTNLFASFTKTGHFSAVSFSGFLITDVNNTIDSFTSVTINALTNMVGFDASRISFDENHIWVNWQGLGINRSTVVSLDINGRGRHDVPEPESLALLCIGLTGLAVLRRRNQQ
jgi:hypothetical protein